jgi:hypothetical protein
MAGQHRRVLVKNGGGRVARYLDTGAGMSSSSQREGHEEEGRSVRKVERGEEEIEE